MSQGDREPATRLLDHDAPFPYVQRKSALDDDLMLKIELTRGLGWDSPALTVIETMDSRLSSVEKFARQLLKEYQREHPESGASGYRILDERGRRLKASAI